MVSTAFVCTTFISVIAALVVNSVTVSVFDVVDSFTSGSILSVLAVTELVKGLLVVRSIAKSDNRFDNSTSLFATVVVCCSVLFLDDSIGLDNCESGLLVVSSEFMLPVTIMVFGVSIFICERDIVVTSPTSGFSTSAGRVLDSTNEIFDPTTGPRVELSSLSFPDKSMGVVTFILWVVLSKGLESSGDVVIPSDVPFEDTVRFLLSFPTVSFIASVKRVFAIVISSASNVSFDDRRSFSVTDSTTREVGVGVTVVTSPFVDGARVS